MLAACLTDVSSPSVNGIAPAAWLPMRHAVPNVLRNPFIFDASRPRRGRVMGLDVGYTVVQSIVDKRSMLGVDPQQILGIYRLNQDKERPA